jgi:predicted Fe-Mo cluster-binding NifX family protein
MTICITTATTDRDPLLDARFGRSPYYTFVDLETGETHVEPNELAEGAGGVGAQAAQFVAERGATALVTGQIGPNAFRVLQAAGVATYTTRERSVADALRAYREGRVERVAAPTAAGHQGTT